MVVGLVTCGGVVLGQGARDGSLFEWQAHPSALHALADAHWARDRQSRKLVSEGMISLHGRHLIKAWTKQQSIVATSTAEAELYAGNRAATVSMEVQAFAEEVGGPSQFGCTLTQVLR